MKKFILLGHERRRRGVAVLGIILLAPTLLAAAVLTMAPVVNGAVADEAVAVEMVAGLGDDLAALSPTLVADTLSSGDNFDWPLDQMAAGVGILLVVLIGLPLGYRLIKIRND
ncbi:MAG: hypothetical protein KDI02_09350 [Anaerolineae bacterium]|nr:hypothetical protein [Anaerolineae bacterium]MCB0223883.1 hypothetical protein [Anaerolineae bacterium]MCB9101115.1 hypothetical protein [Anaerolineales bacterium]